MSVQIIIGCTDGKTYESDVVEESYIQEFLDEVDGKIGFGAMSHIVIRTPDEFVDWMDKLISGRRFDGLTPTEVTLVINGQERKFHVNHIVWHEIVRK